MKSHLRKLLQKQNKPTNATNTTNAIFMMLREGFSPNWGRDEHFMRRVSSKKEAELSGIFGTAKQNQKWRKSLAGAIVTQFSGEDWSVPLPPSPPPPPFSLEITDPEHVLHALSGTTPNDRANFGPEEMDLLVNAILAIHGADMRKIFALDLTKPNGENPRMFLHSQIADHFCARWNPSALFLKVLKINKKGKVKGSGKFGTLEQTKAWRDAVATALLKRFEDEEWFRLIPVTAPPSLPVHERLYADYYETPIVPVPVGAMQESHNLKNPQPNPQPKQTPSHLNTEFPPHSSSGPFDLRLKSTKSNEPVSNRDANVDAPVASVASYFSPLRAMRGQNSEQTSHLALVDDSQIDHLVEFGLMGEIPGGRSVYLNTHEPFCLVTVGVQGAGKSHTLGVVLENCLIPFPSVVALSAPMTTMILHYDANPLTPCEAIGLCASSSSFQSTFGYDAPHLLSHNVAVLVSASYYTQRRAMYASTHVNCRVVPLLFSWQSLTASQLKLLMRIDESDGQLYVSQMLDLLRRFQRLGRLPAFNEFMREMDQLCTLPGQGSAFKQRKRLLESIILECPLNSSLKHVATDLKEILAPGVMVVADLTDPLLSPPEANDIFQVLVEKFRALPSRGGKLLVVDEAHKFMSGSKVDGLGRTIVNCVRLMRHDGLRVVISSQSPLSLLPELLELVTVAVIHRFHSAAWFTHLCNKIPLSAEVFDDVRLLDDGEAVVIAARQSIQDVSSITTFRLCVRPRFTRDLGASLLNTA
jgi:hypothetical protein